MPANKTETQTEAQLKASHDNSTAAATVTTAVAAVTSGASPAGKRKTQSNPKEHSDLATDKSAKALKNTAGAAVASASASTASASASAAAPAVPLAMATGDLKEAPDAAGIAVSTNGKRSAAFRNYESSERQETVQKFYKEKNAKQTYAFVQTMEQKYNAGGLCEMGLWECLEFLDAFVDNSDPDTENSQMQHALQTAEAIRAAYPGDDMDWFPLTGLIHDLGKLLSPKGGEPQFCVVGDTHPVGCAFAEENVFHEYFAANPDATHPVYSTKNGVYTPGCGLNSVKMSYGHDEYLYQVAVRNGCTLPPQALAIIRFHSFYPWHQGGAYTHLMDKQDHDNLKWVRAFQKFDLYSKAHTKYDPKALKPLYQKMINKYFPNGGVLKW